MSTETVKSLRQRMIEDMNARTHRRQRQSGSNHHHRNPDDSMSDEIFFDGRVYVSTQDAARTMVVTALKKYAKRNHCSDAKFVSAALELIGGTNR